MATIVEMINPLTGLPEQVDKLDHTAQEIDNAVTRAFKVSTRNFLRNWYFVNPVNQRGVSGTISTTGYFIDGWKLVSGTVQITSTGLVLNGTIEQILEDAIGQPVKATFLASDGVFDASYNDSTKTFTITATGKTLIAAALELGEHQAHFSQDSSGNWVLNEIPDYGEQLSRCQRYFRREKNNTTVRLAFGIGLPISTSNLTLVKQFGKPMRAYPAVSVSAASDFLYCSSALSSGVAATAVARGGVLVPNDIVAINLSGTFTVGTPYIVAVEPGGYMDFNAEL